MIIRFTLVAVLVLVAKPTAAQELVRLDLAELEATRSAVEEGNLAAALDFVAMQCGLLLSESQGIGSTSERALRAREAFLCAEQVGAAVTPAQGYLQVSSALSSALSTYRANLQARQSEEQFLGLRWGVGLGFSIARDDIESQAEVVDGVVLATEERRQRPRAVLEYHKYFWCQGSGVSRTTGCGPFVAVAATEDKVLSGVGLGFMYGRKSAAADNDGFSLGVGLVLDDNVADLADGFEVGQPAPSGATEVRFLTKARWSLLVFVTRTF